jgi:hypothetical protein
VQRRRREERVPRDLTVVVGVDVDEAGGDEPPGRVDLLSTLGVDPPDRGDATVVDGDVGVDCRSAGAVDDRAPADHEIMHSDISWLWPPHAES